MRYIYYLFCKTFYNLIWLPVRLFFLIFFHFKTERKVNLRKIKGPLIIAANHGAWLDPFLIGAGFPFMSKVFPIRFACWYKYFYSPRFIIFNFLLGSFPVRKGIGLDKALKSPIKILKRKGVIGIFPEGRRSKEGKLRGKRGAAYLSYMTGAKILPVKIEGNINMKFTKAILGNYRIKVKTGIPFSLPDKKIKTIEDLNQSSDLIMEKIWEL